MDITVLIVMGIGLLIAVLVIILAVVLSIRGRKKRRSKVQAEKDTALKDAAAHDVGVYGADVSQYEADVSERVADSELYVAEVRDAGVHDAGVRDAGVHDAGVTQDITDLEDGGVEPSSGSLPVQIIPGRSYYICIHNANNNGQVWDVSLETDILVGRDENCGIRLTDKSVSRQHCRIYASNLVMIENLSKTNTTKLNDRRFEMPAELDVGDRFKCGRISFVVDSIYTKDSIDDDPDTGTLYINV